MPKQGGSNYLANLRIPLSEYPLAGTRTNLAITNAYVHVTSGIAMGYRIQCRTAEPINEFYFFADVIGTPTMSFVIYNEHASTATQPGNTARATGTFATLPTAGSTNKWIKVTFSSPYTPAVGEILFAVLSNAHGTPASNYLSPLTGHVSGPAVTTVPMGSSTSNGFSSSGSTQPEAPWVIVQGTDTIYGNPITNSGNMLAANNLQRGFVIRPPVDTECYGIHLPLSNIHTGVRIYDDTDNTSTPASTPLYSFALGSIANQSRDEVYGVKIFPTPILLERGRRYLVALTVSASLATPGMFVEDYSAYPTLFDSFLDYYMHCPYLDDGGGGWRETHDRFPAMQFMVSGYPAPGNRASYALGI